MSEEQGSVVIKTPSRFSQFYDKYQNHGLVLFFLAGLLLDIFTLTRIDSLAVLAQHAIYIAVIGFLLTFEVVDVAGQLHLPRWLQKLWHYRDEVVHFFLGSLLSAFAVFYFQSASLISSFLFLTIIVFLLVANELPQFKRIGLTIRFIVFSVCVLSFLCYLVPIILGHVGFFPFVISLTLSAVILFGIFLFLDKRLHGAESLKTRIAIPTQLVFVVFFLLYIFQLIPPIPLAIKKIGIYHNVERTSDGYVLSHEQPWWKFWRSGDQQFLYIPGDKIYCYFSIFSPTGFEDEVKVRWLYDGRDGWSSSDAIPVKIAGGRDSGFRGFTWKGNYQEGEWQVRVETVDGREIGRLYFTVAKAEDTGRAREYFQEIH